MATKILSLPLTNYSQLGSRQSSTNKNPGGNGVSWVKIKNKTTSSITVNIFGGTTPSIDTYLYLYRENSTSPFATDDDSGSNGESLINNVVIAAGETIYAWCTKYSAQTIATNFTVDFEVRNLINETDVTILKYDAIEALRLNPTLSLLSVENKLVKLNIKDLSTGYSLDYKLYAQSLNQPKTLINSFTSMGANKDIYAGIGINSPFLESDTEYTFTLECSGVVSTEIKTVSLNVTTKSEISDISQKQLLTIENEKLIPKLNFELNLNDYKNLLKENIFELENITDSTSVILGNLIFNQSSSFMNKNEMTINIFPLVKTGSLNGINENGILKFSIPIEYDKKYKLKRTIKDIQFNTTEDDTITNFNLITQTIEYNFEELREIKILNIVKNNTSKNTRLEIIPNTLKETLPVGYDLFYEFVIDNVSKSKKTENNYSGIFSSNTQHKIECKLYLGQTLENSFLVDTKEYLETLPKLNKPILTVENKKSYANMLNFKVPFNDESEPNIIFDIYRSEINKKSGDPLEFSEFSFCNKDPSDDQFILRYSYDGFMLDPKKITKDTENNIYLCLDMKLGFYSQEDKKWHSIYDVNSYYSQVVCIMLNNSKDTLYFSTRSFFLKYDIASKVVTTIYDISNCINLPQDLDNYPTHNIIETTNGIYFIFNNRSNSYYNTTIYKLYNDSLVFIREIPNTGIIRNCYFDLEFQEIRLICNRNLYSYNYDLFNDSVIFFLDEFCSVKTKTYTYDNLKDEEKLYNCRFFFDKENNVLYHYLFREYYDGEKNFCSNKLFEYNNSKNIFEEKHTEFLSKLNNKEAIKLIQNGIVVDSRNLYISERKTFIKSLDGSINKEITMYESGDVNSPYYKPSQSASQAIAFYSFDDMVLCFSGAYTMWYPEPNEIVFEKYIINKEEVSEELLIARNITTDNFLDKKCKSGKTYQYRVNAKDKDSL